MVDLWPGDVVCKLPVRKQRFNAVRTCCFCTHVSQLLKSSIKDAFLESGNG